MVSEELGLVGEGSRKVVARGSVGLDFQTIVGQDLASEALASQSLQRIQLEGRVLLVALAVVVVPGEVEIRQVMVGCSGEPSSNLNVRLVGPSSC